MMRTNFGDIVDVLREQHDLLARLAAEVRTAAGADKERLFAEFTELLWAHEYGERMVVHPATRDRARGGDQVGRALLAEEQLAAGPISELKYLGVHDPGFGPKFVAFHRLLLDHSAREERDEWPLLRLYVTTERLHTMANEIRNVQAMC